MNSVELNGVLGCSAKTPLLLCIQFSFPCHCLCNSDLPGTLYFCSVEEDVVHGLPYIEVLCERPSILMVTGGNCWAVVREGKGNREEDGGDSDDHLELSLVVIVVVDGSVFLLVL